MMIEMIKENRMQTNKLKLTLEKRIAEVKEIIEIKAEPIQFWRGKLSGLESVLSLINELEKECK